MPVEKLGTKWLEVDIGQYLANIDHILHHVRPAGIIPVIKANAYGHGMVEMARALDRHGIRMLAVASIDEAVELRRQFISCGILVLGAVPIGEIPDIINYGLTATVCDSAFAKLLSTQARAAGRRVPCHFYVDTGMGRMGENAQDARVQLEQTLECPGLEVTAIYSHFAVADEIEASDREYTARQRREFLEFANHQPFRHLHRHMANSGGVLELSAPGDQHVRPGLLCYGVSPNRQLPDISGVQPVLSMKCRPLYIKNMTAGDCVGYGRAFRLDKPTRIMTLPVGYADGVPRRLAGNLCVSALGQTFPVVGRICMDMMMVDIGICDMPLDAEVTLLGTGAQSIYDWAGFTETIPYELLTQLGRRWSRVYMRDGQVLTIARPV